MRIISTPLLSISLIGFLLIGCVENNNSTNEGEQKNNLNVDLNEDKETIQDLTKRFTEAHILKDQCSEQTPL